MLFNTFLIILNSVGVYSIIIHPSVSRLELPFAPYNVKMFCRSGLATAENKRIMNPVLCPSASTTCGYFSIPSLIDANEKTVIYECIDSSVFTSENDEGSRDVYYSYLCSHQSRCHKLPLIRLNRQFLSYLEQTYRIDLSVLIESGKPIKFCCSNNHVSLVQLVNSNSSYLSTNSTPIRCGERQCLSGAVGCLSHKKEKITDVIPSIHTHDDYLDIKPVEVIWQYDESFIEELSTMPTMINEEEDPNHLHCVYPHFNDELYRYCLMIEAQNTEDQCWEPKGHKICCCLIKNGEEACIPSTETITTTTTTTPKPTQLKSRQTSRRKITAPPIRKKKCQRGLSDSENKMDCEEAQSNSYKSTGNYLFMLSVLFYGIFQ